MNAEELKKLKKGDEIFIRARFVNVLGDGDVLFSHSATNAYDNVVREESYTHPENVIIPPPSSKREPYSVGKSDYKGFVNIEKKGKIIAMIPYGKELHEYKTEEEAKAAAEAECNRLNDEHRKEQA